MQRLTYVVFINLAHYYWKRLCQPCAWSTHDFACALFSFPDQQAWYLDWERDYMCACVQIIKWHPSQRTATTKCCEWLLLTRLNLKLWRRRVVVELRTVIRISFVLKWWWALKPFLRYRCWNIEGWTKKERTRKMALSWPHTFAFRCLPHGFWPLIWDLLITKALKEEAWALK